MIKRFAISSIVLLSILGFSLACPFDSTLRVYLNTYFWMPFAKHPGSFERPNVRRISAPFAGMGVVRENTTIGTLRASYQRFSKPDFDSLNQPGGDFSGLRRDLAAAQADTSLSARDREEVRLLEAKIDMREGQPETPEPLERAKTKFQAFLRTARTPEFLSEARGWLAHVYYLLGDQAGAGKIYLDELNRDGSNLSRSTLLNSLHMTYGYDGGQELRDHLADYFDTPAHAAFAIQLVTNPHSHGEPRAGETYSRLKALIENHADLLRSNTGANALALLSIRAALRMGDPQTALEIARQVPRNASVRNEPDFQWMLAASSFLVRDYAGAEQPLLALYQSNSASFRQKAAAAYALCGVYFKTGNQMEQLRYALALRSFADRDADFYPVPTQISEGSIYLAVSGWDLNLILEFGASIDVLRQFINENPAATGIRTVKYSLAVRLARENQYPEAAALYESIGAYRRAARMRRLAALDREMDRADLTDSQRLEARYQFAAYLSANSNRIYFNDSLWQGYQAYAFQAGSDSRLTRSERDTMIAGERKLQDDQEELWRAYLILRDTVRQAGNSDIGRRSAALPVRDLRRISSRFGRAADIRKADSELSKWLRNPIEPLP